MKSKLYGLWALCLTSVVMLLGLLAACSPSTEKAAPPNVASSFPMEVIDNAGRAVKIGKIPERIISLAPSNTEILYALQLEDRLVGVTKYCDYPEAAKNKPKVGEFSIVDIEKVVELQPDLILATDIHKTEVVPQLERLGLTVLIIYPKTIDGVLEAINLVGKLAGKEERASRLISEMQNRIRTVTDKTSALSETQRRKVFYILWHAPLMTAGPGTLIHELMVKAGGINIAQNLTDSYPTISLEAVIAANPQVIIAGSGHGTGENVPFRFALTEPRLKDIDARRNGRIYEIDSNLTSRQGPRIVDGLEKLAQFIHPELFKESR